LVDWLLKEYQHLSEQMITFIHYLDSSTTPEADMHDLLRVARIVNLEGCNDYEDFILITSQQLVPTQFMSVWTESLHTSPQQPMSWKDYFDLCGKLAQISATESLVSKLTHSPICVWLHAIKANELAPAH